MTPPLSDVRWLDYLETHPDLLLAAAEASPETQAPLRAEHPPEAVAAALTLCELRRKAVEKFSRGDRLWCDRVRLEQATSEPVAVHKARRFVERAGGEVVTDLCGGLGGDAVALGLVGLAVSSVDRDPAAGWMTGRNATLYGVGDRVRARTGDVTDGAFGGAGRLVHIDPDRRPAGETSGRRRERRIEDYSPELPFLQELAATAGGGAIKVSPAANWGGKFPGAEVELISAGGECREATVWFGSLADPDRHRATVLSGSLADPVADSLVADPFDAAPVVGPVGSHLFDPDPAVVRAGLVDELCARTGLRRLDDAEEYLTGDFSGDFLDTPFAAGFEVLEVCPNNARRYRAAVRAAGAGDVEVKCRHLPVSAAAVRRKLPLSPGGPRLTLIFAKVAGRATAVLCRRVIGAGHLRG